MGLDVYAGSLTRYYSGDWDTLRRPEAAEGRGFLDHIIDLFTGNKYRNAARAVESWRRQIARQLNLGDSLLWNDAPEGEYVTGQPGWDAYGALLLWASYEEQPNARRATSPENWSSDAAYRAAAMNPQSRYLHLVGGSEIWLPIDFPAPLETKSLLNENVSVASSVRLLAELDELNRRTWNATNEQLEEWRNASLGYGATLEASARFGFAVFHKLAGESVRRKLPMKLDY